MVVKRQTKEKQLTQLMLHVCQQAAYIRRCYYGSSWEMEGKITKKKTASVYNNKKQTPKMNNKVKENALNELFSTEKVCMYEAYMCTYMPKYRKFILINYYCLINII